MAGRGDGSAGPGAPRFASAADDPDEEITAVHSGDLELRPTVPPLVRLPPPDEHTVLLAPDGLRPGRAPVREETTVLDPSALPPGDGGWATVVLPGGGHPDHVADRTQILALDDDPADRAASASIVTATLGASRRGPEPGEPSTTPAPTPAPARSITVPARSITVPAMPTAAPGPAPAAWPAAGSTPISGQHAAVGGAITGGYPTVGTPATGGYPAVPRPRAAGRAPRGSARPFTGPHPPTKARASDDDSTRLAWGFLVGVLIAVAIMGGAIAAVLLILRS